ncbi:uncharacterized protein LOC127834351 isoform X1 [Dreissena polymorpha]|uniref:uncharacterized protein LOC127834351 isoform X1 n=1 Tax=Dreissena polymorpha TaxID=45954 RepID=UPI002264A2B2|nr:uncharacterized protein LOC127834351 isoform X1 [Dreissena polymorpha]
MDNFLRTIRAIRRRIEATILNIEKYKYNKVVLLEIQSTLEEELSNFTVKWDEFHEYLSIIENEIPEAKAEKGAQVVLKKALEEKVELSVRIINTLLTAPDNAEEDESSVSGSRRSSRSSNSSRSKAISDAVIERKVKAETARARLQYVEEAERLKKEQYELELSVQKRRSEMESNLNILKCKQEVVESEAELRAVEEMLNENCSVKSEAVKSVSSISKKSKSEIVNDYLNKLPARPDSQSKIQQDTFHLRPSAPEFVPQTTANFANYMVKKDLLLSRVTKFNDRPEQFYTWKISFRSICTEIETNDREELDLLLKNLGPESGRQANSIRNANPHDVHGALEKIWERLDLRFGAPEQVADSLRRRVDAFQKKGNEKEKLYDLADLIEEINSVKSNSKYSGSMSFYDSSLGVNSILCKLPLFVQNKWVDHCSNYKIKNYVMYPPFQVFVDFVRKMAVRQNDPSFNLHALGKPDTTKAIEKSSRLGSRTGVYSRKTNAHSDNCKTKNRTEPYCVIHGQNSRHELKDCKSFLQKSIQEKREIVKKQGLCFKCMTYKHLASECKVPVKCERCNKSSHCTAFHIDTETLKNQGGETPRSSEHGGEPKNQVSPRCTEICGSVIGGISCAKTMLVSVYPEGERHKAIQCYAVVDDQSNRTLGKSEIFDLFSNSSTCVQENYTLSTCAGSVKTVGRRMSGLAIESHDNTCVLKCPAVLECNDIPDNKGEIATPNIARLYPHLKDIAHLVPEFCPEAESLLLIGRDMSEAHHVLDQKVGNNSEPYAQQLRLG